MDKASAQPYLKLQPLKLRLLQPQAHELALPHTPHRCFSRLE